ncbi:MAG: elongation factor P [Candidatus Hepatoplasma scabrum]|nr:MAG: elongation factor P [Candidatus Hepatoplasma sp.]
MADQINVNEFKQGITFLRNNQVYQVIEASHAKSGRGQAHVKVKAKNLFTNSLQNLTFIGGEKVEKAYVTKKEAQFLYFEGNKAFFMDTKNFDQIEIIDSKVDVNRDFLGSGVIFNLIFYENKLIEFEIPKNMMLEVIETVDAIKGDTVTNATKKAKLETGLLIDVPQFISINDKVLINTETKKYVSKVS